MLQSSWISCKRESICQAPKLFACGRATAVRTNQHPVSEGPLVSVVWQARNQPLGMDRWFIQSTAKFIYVGFFGFKCQSFTDSFQWSLPRYSRVTNHALPQVNFGQGNVDFGKVANKNNLKYNSLPNTMTTVHWHHGETLVCTVCMTSTF